MHTRSTSLRYILDISCLFVESHLWDLDDTIKDLVLLFDNSFLIASSLSLDVIRVHINPLVHSPPLHAFMMTHPIVAPEFIASKILA